MSDSPIRNRIVGFKAIPGADLEPHPDNWRTHPEQQQTALRASLTTLGITDALVVRKKPGKNSGYQILDGHCRKDLAPEVEWPCLVLDLSDQEAQAMLATHDQITAMAETDGRALSDLIKALGGTENELLTAVWPDYVIVPLDGAEWSLPGSGGSGSGGDQEPLVLRFVGDQRVAVDEAIAAERDAADGRMAKLGDVEVVVAILSRKRRDK